MGNSATRTDSVIPVLVVGIDWADQKHDLYWIDASGQSGRRTVDQTPQAIEELVAWMTEKAGGGPIALALEKSRGPLQNALTGREGITLYPIDPKQFASYRESFTSSRAKSDLGDACLLARLLHERRCELRPLVPDDEPTRRIGQLSEARRQLVDECTRLKLQLQALLKTYFPLLLTWGDVASGLVLEVLRRWPDPRQFRRAHPQTLTNLLHRHGLRNDQQVRERIEAVRQSPLLTRDAPLIEALGFRVSALVGQLKPLLEQIAAIQVALDRAMAAHPDAALFQGPPGAGKAMAPRLLAAFGSDRERYADADEVAVISGIAPVTRQSGKTRIVTRRRACSRFLKQTFHEFADHARKWCCWSKAYYAWLKSKGMRHHAAVRKLASRWIRILYRVWKTRTPYDQDRYLLRLREEHHPLLKFLDNSIQPA
jgi:transposase